MIRVVENWLSFKVSLFELTPCMREFTVTTSPSRTLLRYTPNKGVSLKYHLGRFKVTENGR